MAPGSLAWDGPSLDLTSLAAAAFDLTVRLPPFQNLLDAHDRDVHRFLIAIVGPVDADDVYQETWLAALRAYPQLTGASNLKGWLLTIAHRKAIDHVRARARRATPVAEPADLPHATAARGAGEGDA